MCDCIEKINAQIEASGFKIGLALAVNRKTGKTRTTTQVLCVRKNADSTKFKNIDFLPSVFCPFCGEKYEQEAL